ncbi:MAG TPA: hypothetical protein VFF40_14735 [Acidimicrobiia bacterium]|nr:hypothetical protein [Acidimicrobiia bacterium]
MDLDFGHGFVPRIGEENYKAVDTCIGPADLFSTDRLDLPWSIVDGAWAQRSPDLLGTLRENGTKLMFDTHGWRYRYNSTFDVSKLSAHWSPPRPPEQGLRSAARPACLRGRTASR